MVETKFWPKTGRPSPENIVFVGQMGPYHGQREVLPSLAPFLQRNKLKKLIFVGGGEEFKKLKTQILKLKLTKQVVLTGQVSQKRVREIFKTCQIGLLPLWNTPVHQARHPLKLLEYLAAGLVVITNDVGEAGRIIKDGKNGLLCPAGEMNCLSQKVEWILAHQAVAHKMSQKAQLTAQEFSVEKILPKWTKFLKT